MNSRHRISMESFIHNVFIHTYMCIIIVHTSQLAVHPLHALLHSPVSCYTNSNSHNLYTQYTVCIQSHEIASQGRSHLLRYSITQQRGNSFPCVGLTMPTENFCTFNLYVNSHTIDDELHVVQLSL